MLASPAIARFWSSRRAPAASPAASADQLDDAFRAALRHSRRVRLLRKLIPAACVLAIVGPFLWNVVAPLARTAANVSVGAVSISGTRIRMDAPKLSGFKKDQKSYEVTARDAVQDLKSPNVVELNNLTGRMEQEANSFVRVTADWGRFDQNIDKLDLKGSVRVRHDKGYEADLRSARVDVKSGDIDTSEPVEIRSKSGTINADSMILRDNGKHVVFSGRVRSVFVIEEADGEEPQAEVKN